ncbi:MAG: lipoprotein [Xanthomonadales bacterium]|nr:lipoprotein [Xanthomonadales bacterium]
MRAFVLLACLAALTACGNKGDLYLRDPIAPPAMTPAELAAAKAAAEADAARSGPSEPEPRRERRRRTESLARDI